MKLRNIFICCCLILGLLCPVSAKRLRSEKIVFSSNRDGNWEVYMMNPDGTRQERLTYDRAVDWEPVISPTGDQILFTSNRGGTRDLYLMDVDGRNIRPLFRFSEAYRTQPAWSPDGERIAYSHRAADGINIHTVSADAASVKHIVHLKNVHSGYPTWSSDGTEIAFVVADEIHWASRQIRFTNLETHKQGALLRNDFPRMFHPAWSPIDNRIAFVWFRPKEQQQSVFIVNRDGSYSSRIASFIANAPAWAPSGDALIYGKVPTKGDKMLPFVMNTSTQKVVLSLAAVLIAGLGIGIPVAAQTVVIEDGLIGYWSFDKDTVKGNTVKDIWGNQDAEMIGNLQIVPGKFGEAVQLGGGAGARVQITDDIKKAELPTEEMTIELWAWDEQFIEWGGYIVAVQDNGAFEKGWLLGTRWKAFSFALSSKGADDGDGLLTYLNSANSYDMNKWHHVVGTYDGEEMKIYVNGKLEGTSSVQSGKINYPDSVFFSIGSYKDDNEDFVHKGMLDEVRLYDRALSEKEVSNNLKADRLAVEPARKLSLTWGQIKATTIR